LGYPGYGPGPLSWYGQSGIFHWSEQYNCFSLVANGFYYLTTGGSLLDLGVWQTNVQRPSLAIDTTDGYLYCAYMQYDSNCFSEAGYAMADVYISVSTDNGTHWSVGTNVTRTSPGENIPAPGSRHEREPTLSETVTDGVLHLFYELDRDAGSCVQTNPEGVCTLNPMLYQRVAVDSIAITPLVPAIQLHWDSTEVCPTLKAKMRFPLVNKFALNSTYPNPFNSTTNISFELPRRMYVELKVYDILGREVAILQSGVVDGGSHQITWHAASSSGIYFLALHSGSITRVQKVMLLR
jgi:hypothetical protein